MKNILVVLGILGMISFWLAVINLGNPSTTGYRINPNDQIPVFSYNDATKVAQIIGK